MNDEGFWNRVLISDGCWEWRGRCDRKGYGRVYLGAKHHPTYTGAHRVSWALTFGPIPDGLCVLHNCPDGDNPRCVRPDHLFLGTVVQNNQDMIAKGRANHPGTGGARNGAAKLSDAEVSAIRRAYAGGNASTHQLARHYQVSRRTITRAISGKTWTEVATSALPVVVPATDRKLTDDEVRSIRQRYKPRVVSQYQLAREFGISQMGIFRILHELAYTHVR